jgi:gp16 family phage-associated protein
VDNVAKNGRAIQTEGGNIRTRQEARAWLNSIGKGASTWAKEKGLCPTTTLAVLDGRLKGHRGEAHKVAVALNLKVGVIA